MRSPQPKARAQPYVSASSSAAMQLVVARAAAAAAEEVVDDAMEAAGEPGCSGCSDAQAMPCAKGVRGKLGPVRAERGLVSKGEWPPGWTLHDSAHALACTAQGMSAAHVCHIEA